MTHIFIVVFTLFPLSLNSLKPRVFLWFKRGSSISLVHLNCIITNSIGLCYACLALAFFCAKVSIRQYQKGKQLLASLNSKAMPFAVIFWIPTWIYNYPRDCQLPPLFRATKDSVDVVTFRLPGRSASGPGCQRNSAKPLTWESSQPKAFCGQYSDVRF